VLKIKSEERNAETKIARAIAGFDLTFSAPKSVSVAWALADGGTQGVIYGAHQQALAYVLRYAEQCYRERCGGPACDARPGGSHGPCDAGQLPGVLPWRASSTPSSSLPESAERWPTPWPCGAGSAGSGRPHQWTTLQGCPDQGRSQHRYVSGGGA